MSLSESLINIDWKAVNTTGRVIMAAIIGISPIFFDQLCDDFKSRGEVVLEKIKNKRVNLD